MARHSPSAAVADDRGATSLTTVLLTPAFLAVAMMAFQAALWSHARAEARAIARDSASMLARSGASPDAVERSARRLLTSDTELIEVDVAVTVAGGWVTVRVAGKAPGMLRGTRASVEAVEAMPIEGWRP